MTDTARTAIAARQELEQTGRAFDMLEEALMAEMFATALDQTAKREKIFFGVRALRMVRQALENAASYTAVEDYRAELAKAGFTQP